MADEQKVVLVEIDININSAIEAQKKLAETIVDLKAKTANLADTEGKLSEAYLKSSAELKAAQAELRKSETLTRKIVEANQAAAGSIDQLSAELAVVNYQWRALSEEERNNSDSGKALAADKKRLTEAINAEKMALGDTTSNIGNYEESIKSLKLELRENTLALAKMKAAGEDNTEAYKKLLITTGELADTIGDTRAEINAYASDTRALDQAIGVFKGIGAAAQVAEGATALLGVENEDLTKSIQKMVAIQSVLSGVQEIQNSLQKESAFMMGVKSAQTKAAAAAEAIYAAAVGTSTGAMKAFRIALLATGIGALVVGIGLLISNWDSLSEAIGITTDNTKSHSKAIDGTIIVDEKLREEHNNHIKTLSGLQTEYETLTGKISEYEAAVRNLNDEYAIQLLEIQNNTNKAVSEVGGFWSTVGSSVVNFFKTFGNGYKAYANVVKEQQKETEAIIKAGNNRAVALAEEIAAKRKVIDAEEAKRINDELAKTSEERAKKEKAAAEKRAEEARKIREQYSLEELEALTSGNDDIKDELDRLNEYQKNLSEDRTNKELSDIQRVIDRHKEAAAINDELNFTDLEKLTLKYEEQKRLLEEFGYSTVALEQQFSDAKIAIAWKETQAKLSAFNDTGNALSALGDLAGKKTAEGKLLAIAGATINAFSGIAATLGAPTTIPEPFGSAAKIAQSVVIGANAFKQVKEIAKVKVPKSGGGPSLAGAGSATAAVVPRASVNPEIGKGMVSRDSSTGTSASVTAGVQQGMAGVVIQPTLVVDDVTAKQNQSANIAKTATY